MGRKSWFVLFLAAAWLLVACSTGAADQGSSNSEAGKHAWSKVILDAEGCAMRINDVQTADRYPSGCKNSASDCLVMNEGKSILTVWLEVPASCNVESLAESLSRTQDIYLIAPNGEKAFRMITGVNNKQLVFGFPISNPDQIWQLAWGGNPPVDLSK